MRIEKNSPETAEKAGPIWGSKPYQQKARQALPLLISLARSGKTSTYGELAEQLGVRARNMNFILGSVGKSRLLLAKSLGEAIPPLESIIVTRGKDMPGVGVDPLLPTGLTNRKLGSEQRRAMIESIHRSVFEYPKWAQVEVSLRQAIENHQAGLPEFGVIARQQQRSIASFFTEVLGANLRNVRWSWGAERPDRNRIYLRVWEDDIHIVQGREAVRILGKAFRKSNPGFSERTRHVQALSAGAEGFGVLCVAARARDSEARRIESFDQKHLLSYGKLLDAQDGTYAEITGRVPVDQLEESKTSTSTLAEDLVALSRWKGEATQKEALINARIGQGQFRAGVLAMWKRRCAVTGTETLAAIRASHIKPWRNCSDKERLDPENGLPLVATLDALFDEGLISFEADGAMVVSSRVSKVEASRLGLEGLSLGGGVKGRGSDYLAWHRQRVFRR